MDPINPLTFIQVSAQVPSIDPDLQTPPRKADFGINISSVVGVRGKCHSWREHTRVAAGYFVGPLFIAAQD